MFIKATSRVKGILDLSGIGVQLTPGSTHPVTEKQFHDNTVQIAIKMGLLTCDKTEPAVDYNENRMVTLRNIFDREIAVSTLETTVRPGATFSISEEHLNREDIRAALAKGMFEIISTTDKRAILTETAINIDAEGNISESESDVHTGMVIDMNEDNGNDTLETNEELGTPKVVEMRNVIDVENPPPVQPSDVPDPKKQSIVWNPNKDPIRHSSGSEPFVESDGSPDEISFVDKEVESQKRESHPLLKDVPLEKNDDQEFII